MVLLKRCRLFGFMSLAFWIIGTTGCEPILDLRTPPEGASTDGAAAAPGAVRANIRPKRAVNVPPSPTEQITLLTDDATKGWLLKRRIKNNAEATDHCLQDDGLILHKTNRIDFEVGRLTCGIDDRPVSGVWQLTDRPSLLLRSGDAPPYEAQLLELSKNRMVLTYNDVEGDVFIEHYETPVIEPEPDAGPIVLEATPAPAQPSPSAAPSASPTSDGDVDNSTGDTGTFGGF